MTNNAQLLAKVKERLEFEIEAVHLGGNGQPVSIADAVGIAEYLADCYTLDGLERAALLAHARTVADEEDDS